MKLASTLRKTIAGAALLGALATAAHAQLSVLFLGSFGTGGVNATRVDILGADPRFNTATSTSFNWSIGNLPSLAFLNQFDAVLAWTDSSYEAAMSNLLADYVDAGGGVVIATFWGQEVDGIAGGGRLETTGYNPLVNSTFDAYNPGSLGAFDASSPLFNGVASLSATTYRGDYLPGLDAGATLAASWSDGRPLLAFNAAHNVVNLTLTPTVSTLHHATGDYQQLFRNSLAFVGNAPVPGAVPEPSTYGLLSALALGAVVYIRRRK